MRMHAASGQRARLGHELQCPLVPASFDERASDDGWKQDVEERRSGLAGSIQAQLTVVDGKGRLAEGLIEKHPGELVLGGFHDTSRVHSASELLHQPACIEGSRTEELQQCAEEEVKEVKPGHAEVLDDRAQPIEGLEAFVVLADERCVVTEKHEPAGMAKR